MTAYNAAEEFAAAEAILANFNSPDASHSSWWINPGVSARAVLDAVAPAIAARALRTYASDLEDNPSADDWDRKHEFVSDVRVYANDVERGIL